MGIVMLETFSAYKKYNKIISDIYLVFYSSVITMMHGPINIRFGMVTRLWTAIPRSRSSIPKEQKRLLFFPKGPNIFWGPPSLILNFYVPGVLP